LSPPPPSVPLGSNKNMLALRDHIESVTDGDDDVIVPTGKSWERREGTVMVGL
jgi:hypothetical protein